MSDPRCIVTAPLPLANGLDFGALAMVVSADALVRRAWAVGRAAELIVPTSSGDLVSQYAFDRELAREGHDRGSLDAGEIAKRRAVFHEERRVAAAEALARLSVTADLGSSTTVSPEVERAATTAFVRLFEEGLIAHSARVVPTCPRCRTVLDAADTELGEIDSELLTLRLPVSTGVDVDVRLCEPELLPGAVAVAVPEHSRAAGGTVALPLAERTVPVIASAVHREAALVVAGHDGEAHDFAVAHGLAPLPVLDDEGAVRVPGPLEGLPRYAARAAARALLESEGVVVAAEPAREEVVRCRCCGSVMVPQLARHWFLRSRDLEVAAADAIRNGLVTLSPPDAREAFLAHAGGRSDWCLSTSIDGGVAVPASRCGDCGSENVDLDGGSSCGKCMGECRSERQFLDSRFVSAMWAVALGGWPGRASGTPPEETLAVVTTADLGGWVLPAIALGLRLVGTPPFSGVIVHPWPDVLKDDQSSCDAEIDRRVLRLSLVAGVDGLEAAAAAVAALDRPAADGIDAAEAATAAAAGIAALDDGSPAQAAGLLASALSAGVPAEAADRLRALALPILGD